MTKICFCKYIEYGSAFFKTLKTLKHDDCNFYTLIK